MHYNYTWLLRISTIFQALQALKVSFNLVVKNTITLNILYKLYLQGSIVHWELLRMSLLKEIFLKKLHYRLFFNKDVATSLLLDSLFCTFEEYFKSVLDYVFFCYYIVFLCLFLCYTCTYYAK